MAAGPVQGSAGPKTIGGQPPLRVLKLRGACPPDVVKCSTLCIGKYHEMQGAAACRFLTQQGWRARPPGDLRGLSDPRPVLCLLRGHINCQDSPSGGLNCQVATVDILMYKQLTQKHCSARELLNLGMVSFSIVSHKPSSSNLAVLPAPPEGCHDITQARLTVMR